jgi:hypothetical protein
MAYETIKLAAVRALLGTCTSHAISAEFTDSNDGRLYFAGVNESLLDGGITLHYEECVIYDTWRAEYLHPLAESMESAFSFMYGPAYRAAQAVSGPYKKYGGWFYLTNAAGERLEIVDGNGDEIDIDRIRLPRPFTTVFYPEAPYNLSK